MTPRAVPRPTCYGCGDAPPMDGSHLCVVCHGIQVRYTITLLGVALVLGGSSLWNLVRGEYWLGWLFCLGLLAWVALAYALPSSEWMTYEVEE